ncbi:PTS sugar transporter subunit IIA [Paenibacillus lentus]|uniref:PTS sugar transporter subunit IIA n=1 Tax=Paenibacillus lentus TaxID=1338368 RepID=UPI00364A0B16
MKDVINKRMIFLQQNFETRDDVLRVLIENALQNGLISEQKPFLQAVLDREANVPTAIGYQIAIPHGKSDAVKQPFIGFLQAKHDFRWTEGYEEEVKLIFLIGVPKANEQNIHLKFISRLSKKLLDDNFRMKLLESTDVEQVYQLLNSIY